MRLSRDNCLAVALGAALLVPSCAPVLAQSDSWRPYGDIPPATPPKPLHVRFLRLQVRSFGPDGRVSWVPVGILAERIR